MDQSINPLALFPTKKDVIRHNFVGLSKSKSLTSATRHSQDDSGQWLHEDKIDPTVYLPFMSSLMHLSNI